MPRSASGQAARYVTRLTTDAYPAAAAHRSAGGSPPRRAPPGRQPPAAPVAQPPALTALPRLRHARPVRRPIVGARRSAAAGAAPAPGRAATPPPVCESGPSQHPPAAARCPDPLRTVPWHREEGRSQPRGSYNQSSELLSWSCAESAERLGRQANVGRCTNAAVLLHFQRRGKGGPAWSASRLSRASVHVPENILISPKVRSVDTSRPHA
jgi:hypothetical protein